MDGFVFHVRMGLHIGTAEERYGDYFGAVVRRAARLMGVVRPAIRYFNKLRDNSA